LFVVERTAVDASELYEPIDPCVMPIARGYAAFKLRFERAPQIDREIDETTLTLEVGDQLRAQGFGKVAGLGVEGFTQVVQGQAQGLLGARQVEQRFTVNAGDLPERLAPFAALLSEEEPLQERETIAKAVQPTIEGGEQACRVFMQRI